MVCSKSETQWVSEWVEVWRPLDTLQVISETVLQAITCTGTTDNKNYQQNQSNQHKENKIQLTAAQHGNIASYLPIR